LGKARQQETLLGFTSHDKEVYVKSKIDELSFILNGAVLRNEHLMQLMPSGTTEKDLNDLGNDEVMKLRRCTYLSATYHLAVEEYGWTTTSQVYSNPPGVSWGRVCERVTKDVNRFYLNEDWITARTLQRWNRIESKFSSLKNWSKMLRSNFNLKLLIVLQ
jgi:hypothetical protein